MLVGSWFFQSCTSFLNGREMNAIVIHKSAGEEFCSFPGILPALWASFLPNGQCFLPVRNQSVPYANKTAFPTTTTINIFPTDNAAHWSWFSLSKIWQFPPLLVELFQLQVIWMYLYGTAGNCESCHLITNWVTFGKSFKLSFIISSKMQLSPLTLHHKTCVNQEPCGCRLLVGVPHLWAWPWCCSFSGKKSAPCVRVPKSWLSSSCLASTAFYISLADIHLKSLLECRNGDSPCL